MKWSLMCLAAGLVSACGFAPLDLWPLTLIAVAFLLWAVERAPRLRSALSRGWWFGLGQFVLGLNWIATAFTYQSNMPAWLGWVGVVLLSLYLALFPAAAAGLAWRWSGGDRLRLVLIFAAAWIVTEFLRAVLFTGFPWNPLGISLLLTPAAIFATLAGTYALSGLAALAAGALFLLARRHWAAAAGAVGAVALLVLTAFLAAPSAEGEFGAAVRIVQPNVSQEEKHEIGYGPQLRRFREASDAMWEAGPQLMLLPEDAIPFLLDEDLEAATLIGGWAGPGDLVLAGGAKLERNASGRAIGARNSVWLIDPGGRLLSRYDKAHLVPWGEYLPLRWLLEPIGLARVVPGDLDFWEGPGPRTIDLPGFGRVGIQICYEIVFSGEVVDDSDRPDFIFNPSNDAWFGWWGPPQHLAQARLRALEEGLPVLRSTPTGISAIIDSRGNIVASIPWREAGVIDGRLPPAAPPTLFARGGNLLPFAFALLLVAAAILTRRLPSRAKRDRERAT
jgi:apolipoprotein N-acyltransferase